MSTKLEWGSRPNAPAGEPPRGNALTFLPPVHVPPRLFSVRGLHALPLALSDEPVIYALCTRRAVAPDRVEGEALYVGLTDDLHRRLSEWHAIWWSEQREPFNLVLWWEHPRRWSLEHGVTAHVAEEAFIRYLLPRYNEDREPLTPRHMMALALHGVDFR